MAGQRFTKNGFLPDEARSYLRNDFDLLREEPPSDTDEHFAWFRLLGSLEAEHDPTEASLEYRDKCRKILRDWKDKKI